MPNAVRKKESPLAQTQQLYSVLQKFGGSLLGAQQLLRGEVISSPGDRHAIAGLTRELLEVGFVFEKIVGSYAPNKNAGWDNWNARG
jgi:hypothetical protein